MGLPVYIHTRAVTSTLLSLLLRESFSLPQHIQDLYDCTSWKQKAQAVSIIDPYSPGRKKIQMHGVGLALLLLSNGIQTLSLSFLFDQGWGIVAFLVTLNLRMASVQRMEQEELVSTPHSQLWFFLHERETRQEKPQPVLCKTTTVSSFSDCKP